MSQMSVAGMSNEQLLLHSSLKMSAGSNLIQAVRGLVGECKETNDNSWNIFGCLVCFGDLKYS